MIRWNYCLIDSNNICEKCGHICNAKHFQQNFKNWTSGNNNIDKLIQDSQLSAHVTDYYYGISKAALEWIPYDRLTILNMLKVDLDWKRINQNLPVILKILDNPINTVSDFRNEAMLHYKIVDCDKIIRIYGITQEPETKNYVMVLDYAQYGISNYAKIADMGLCKPANYDISENTINGHDINLAIEICRGLRPRFNIKIPQLIVHLIKKCLDADPLNRPTAEENYSILNQWHKIIMHQDFDTELYKQIKEADDFNNNLLTSIIPSTSLGLSYEPHTGAIYISRLLNYDNLPEPKNSYDYYEQNDNIISMKFTGIESLQIDISQLKIVDNNLSEPDDCHDKQDDRFV
ncbi:kinase-like domain-containing protein [Rhizophagus clarus]|uniref:Kinase-like domain-containing protein n=1 Tax=Rhizophagus clarus TaxID=94130 RepID=A0A8H3MH24_9GLOM|nr:kinase-like domain-containing protein [Rhizophagus clarus]